MRVRCWTAAPVSMLLASKSSNLGVQPEMRIWGPTALFPITPHKRVRVLKNGPISSRRRYRSWYVPVASTGRQPPHSEMSATRWDGVDRPHYATSSSCSPWTFVRARSVACAQVPQNTTVTQSPACCCRWDRGCCRSVGPSPHPVPGLSLAPPLPNSHVVPPLHTAEVYRVRSF